MSSADSLVKTELPLPIEARQKGNDADGGRIPPRECGSAPVTPSAVGGAQFCNGSGYATGAY